MGDLDKIDPTFKDDLENSKVAVDAVARWLCNAGYPVVTQPTFVRPDTDSRHEFADGGDLGVIQRVEVKHRPTISFTSKEDFPYDTVIVDVKHSWDNARPKPFAYVICNAELTHCLFISSRTSDKWTIVTRESRGRPREHYECPIELVDVRRLK